MGGGTTGGHGGRRQESGSNTLFASLSRGMVPLFLLPAALNGRKEYLAAASRDVISSAAGESRK
jgi:hypothetical protein